eukprot:8976678-Pyramimonas_sp.AAC.1
MMRARAGQRTGDGKSYIFTRNIWLAFFMVPCLGYHGVLLGRSGDLLGLPSGMCGHRGTHLGIPWEQPWTILECL